MVSTGCHQGEVSLPEIGAGDLHQDVISLSALSFSVAILKAP